MINEVDFIFSHTPENIPKDGALIGILPIGIRDTGQLLNEIKKSLCFPAYFGGNWNALSDCLRDFHWVDKYDVILIHKDLPDLPRNDLEVYIEILHDAVVDWKRDNAHNFIVVFDEKFRGRIKELLNANGQTTPVPTPH